MKLNKRKIQQFILVLLITPVTFTAIAQEFTVIPNSSKKTKDISIGLRIGDSLPDFIIPKVVVSKGSLKKKIRTSDFKDRLLILDFWGTECVPCVQALPRMDSLEKKYGNRLKVLPVTYQKEKFVLNFLKKNKITKDITLESVVEDTVFSNYFKHRGLPHDVWIYKGKVIGITTLDYVDARNIAKVLSGVVPDWPIKDDFFAFDDKKILFRRDSNQINAATTLEYVAMSDPIESLLSSNAPLTTIVRDIVNKTIRTYFLNQPVFTTYNNILSYKIKRDTPLIMPQGFPNPNSVVWEVSDRNRYQWISKEVSGYERDWSRSHRFCFESLHADTGQNDNEIYYQVIRELNALLGLNVRWEKRKEKVLILVRITNQDRLKSKAKIIMTYEDIRNDENPHEVIKGTLHHFRDYKLEDFVLMMNKYEENPYVFDETGYKETADMDLKFASWKDISELRSALQSYGLDLREEERLVDKLVFSEVEGGTMVDGSMIKEAKAKRDVQKTLANPSVEENAAFLADNKKKTGVVSLSSGLQYKIIREGKGEKPVKSGKVTIQYTGTLVNGKIFDSSFETGKPAIFEVTGVLPGLTEALQLMYVGSKWIIYIPAELAYGKHTNQGQLPPNSVLVFEVELLRINS